MHCHGNAPAALVVLTSVRIRGSPVVALNEVLRARHDPSRVVVQSVAGLRPATSPHCLDPSLDFPHIHRNSLSCGIEQTGRNLHGCQTGLLAESVLVQPLRVLSHDVVGGETQQNPSAWNFTPMYRLQDIQLAWAHAEKRVDMLDSMARIRGRSGHLEAPPKNSNTSSP